MAKAAFLAEMQSEGMAEMFGFCFGMKVAFRQSLQVCRFLLLSVIIKAGFEVSQGLGC